LPLAEIESFLSTPVLRLLISVSDFDFRVEEDWARKGVRFHHQPPPTPRRQIAKFDFQPSSDFADIPM
jgi:hypothetical protein